MFNFHGGFASSATIGLHCIFCCLIASLPAFGRDDHEAIADFPFPSKYVEVRSAKMHYVESGSGEPILLLHGNPTNVYIWRNIIPHLANHGRVIAVDLIGFGKSDKPDIEYRFFDHAAYLEEFIEKMGLRNITLVMHDWGSALGFDYASRHPDNIRAVAFLEALLVPVPSYDQWPNQKAAEAFRLYRTPQVGWNSIVNENSFIEKRIQDGTIRVLSEAELQHYREPFKDPKSRKPMWRWPNELPIAGEPADVFAMQTHYLGWLQKSEVPKLLIFAHPGVLTPEPVVAWAKASLPNLQTVDVGAGIHNLQEDHPQEIGTAIASWMEKIQPGATRGK